MTQGNLTRLRILLRPWCALRGHRYTRRTLHTPVGVLIRGRCLCGKRGERRVYEQAGARPTYHIETEEVR